MNVFRSASSFLAVALVAALAACGSAPTEPHHSVQAQADDVQPCDPANPATWHYDESSVDQSQPILAVVVDGTPVTFDGTCDPNEPAYCLWQDVMIKDGGGSADGVLGWLVTNTCAVHVQYSYRVMFFDPSGPNSETWRVNDKFARESPVFAIGIRDRVPVFVSAGCDGTDGNGLCVSPRLELSDELTQRARSGMAAGDPSNPPLRD